MHCPNCGENVAQGFRLCGYCGTPLATRPAEPAAAKELRKTVTVVFSDLKDSTELGERLDAEALHEVKERYFSVMAAEIHRHGGRIEKYIGDAIMAVFGLPLAHEDPSRARDSRRGSPSCADRRELDSAGGRTLGTADRSDRTGLPSPETIRKRLS